MNQVFLGLGSNLGDREKAVSDAKKHISKKIGLIVKSSSIIETASWGKTNQPNYLNCVIEVNTELWPLELIEKLLKIEIDLGRKRAEKWSSRLIDIDIIYYNNWHFNTPQLEIPHRYISQRQFVLQPLTEIFPNFLHPVLKKSNAKLLEILNNNI